MNRKASLHLEFNPNSHNTNTDKRLQQGLSAVVQIGDALWVANDETTTLESLSPDKPHSSGWHTYSKHRQFSLRDYIELPMSRLSDRKKNKIFEEEGQISEELDIEGLDYRDGYLWLVGSHSWGRRKLDKSDGMDELAVELTVSNRFMLARIPVSDGELAKNISQDDRLWSAAQLLGDHAANELTEALKNDKHFAKFLCIPGKDNGFNIEGLAVIGQRIFVGLRSPILRGWASILELEVEENSLSILRLKKIGPDDRAYRKHFLQLGNLGVRDLCIQGHDLLILAGPSIALDGPVFIFRWAGGANPYGENIIFEDALEKVIEIPHGHGNDHAEGITLFAPHGGDHTHILVVYDDASEHRQKRPNSLKVDIFRLSK